MAQVRVWWVDLARPGPAPESADDRPADPEHPLDRVERAAADRFSAPDLRRRYVAAHRALREILGRATGVPPAGLRFGRRPCPCGRPAGRPVLLDLDGAPEFSLSRCADLAVVAVADRPVGVDLESEAAAGRMAVLADQVHPADRAVLAGPAAELSLLDWWLRTEAVLKLTGEGIRHGIGRFPVLAPPPAPAEEGGTSGPGWTVGGLAAPAGFRAGWAIERTAHGPGRPVVRSARWEPATPA